MESLFRRALADWLRADPVLAGLVDAIQEEGPAPGGPPAVAFLASAAADWSCKTGAGREIRLALELTTRDDDGADSAAIAARLEQRIATLPPAQAGFQVVVTRFLRSRAERRARRIRALLLEYSFLCLVNPE